MRRRENLSFTLSDYMHGGYQHHGRDEIIFLFYSMIASVKNIMQ